MYKAHVTCVKKWELLKKYVFPLNVVVKEKRETAFKAKGDQEGWDIDNLKLLTCVTDRDIVYASFVSEVRNLPFIFLD